MKSKDRTAQGTRKRWSRLAAVTACGLICLAHAHLFVHLWGVPKVTRDAPNFTHVFMRGVSRGELQTASGTTREPDSTRAAFVSAQVDNLRVAPGAAYVTQERVLRQVRKRLVWERPHACVPELDRPVRTTPCAFLRTLAHDTSFCMTPCPRELAALKRGCAATLNVHASMENDGTCVNGSAAKLCMSVHSHADVHMQYFAPQDFSAHELLLPDVAQTLVPNAWRLGFLASFVSNCRPWRVEYLRQLTAALLAHGEPVHHYGMCLRNTGSPYGVLSKYKQKDALAVQHRYVFSFENSETPGYATEKLFYMLAAGAVPVYRGASDVRRMLPSKHAAVVVPREMPPAALAEALVRETPAEYAARLAWRRSALCPKFVANQDYAVWHSTCRACVRVRSMELPVRHDRAWVREQGFVEFTEVPAECMQMDTVAWLLCLSTVICDALPAHERALRPHGVGAVVLVYQAFDRAKCEITDVAQARALPAGAELEVVMQNPGWRRRGARA